VLLVGFLLFMEASRLVAGYFHECRHDVLALLLGKVANRCGAVTRVVVQTRFKNDHFVGRALSIVASIHGSLIVDQLLLRRTLVAA
jgi:hypothetical protein